MIDLSRRDELLAKAAQLFREKGYHATTMKDIAAELAILPGSLYHHIDSKEALLLEIMDRGIQVLLERVRPIAESDDLMPAAKLRRIVHIHITSIAEHPDVLSVFLHELKAIPETHRARQMALRDDYDHLLSQIIADGVAQGQFRPVHPRVATFAILGMVNWLYAWYHPNGSLAPEQIAEQYLALIWDGLAADSYPQQGAP